MTKQQLFLVTQYFLYRMAYSYFLSKIYTFTQNIVPVKQDTAPLSLPDLRLPYQPWNAPMATDIYDILNISKQKLHSPYI